MQNGQNGRTQLTPYKLMLYYTLYESSRLPKHVDMPTEGNRHCESEQRQTAANVRHSTGPCIFCSKVMNIMLGGKP